jgi:hypothetical protein
LSKPAETPEFISIPQSDAGEMQLAFDF